MRLRTSRLARPLAASLVGAIFLCCLPLVYQSSFPRHDSLLADEPDQSGRKTIGNYAGRVQNPSAASEANRGQNRDRQPGNRYAGIEFGDQDASFDRQARQLAKQYRSAPPIEQPKLLQKLKQLNEQHFEYRQVERQKEIENLSGRIDLLRKMQSQRQQNRDEVLLRRLNALIDPNTDLDWDRDPSENSHDSDKSKSENPKASTGVAKTDAAVANASSEEPVYEGKPLSEWLKILGKERSLQSLAGALFALKHLARDADPRVAARAIFRLGQSLTSLYDGIDITDGSLAVLHALPSEIVIDELIVQLDEITSLKLSTAFKSLTTTFIGSIGDLPDRESAHFHRYCRSVYRGEERAFAGFMPESTQSFRPEIRRRSRRLISALAKIAKRDPAQSDWAVETASYVLDLSEQPLSTYQDLIPIVELVFARSRDDSAKGRAAVLLVESGLQKSEAMEFLKLALRQKTIADGTVSLNPILWCARLGRSVPEAVDALIEELSSLWADKVLDPNAFDFRMLTIIRNLGGIGSSAKAAIPVLQSIEKSPRSINSSYGANRFEGPNGQIFKARGNLSADATEAVKAIVEAVAHPIQRTDPQPLPIDESPKEVQTIEKTDRSNATVGVAAGPEPTFDGIAYSRWLLMLETERKSEKLAAAIDACARLAEPRDERRVARGIFLATRRFETGDPAEREFVWEAGWNALIRLSPEEVIEELLVAVRDQSNYKNRKEFLARFVAEKASGPVSALFKLRTDELVDAFLESMAQDEKDLDYLLAAASTVWRVSMRPLDDFPQLKMRMLTFLGTDPIDHGQVFWKEGLSDPWRIVATNLVQQAPDTPDLPQLLMKQARKSYHVVKLIGMLGPKADPIAKDLVDYFVEEWTTWKSQRRDDVFNRGKAFYKPRSQEQLYQDGHRRVQIIQTLGAIGTNEKAIELLHQLNLLARSTSNHGEWERKVFQAVNESAQKFPDIPNAKNLPVVLHDDSMIMGKWILRSNAPESEFHQYATIGDAYWAWYANSKRDSSDFVPGILDSCIYVLDETKLPKRISLIDREGSATAASDGAPNSGQSSAKRQEGIYELTDTMLRIQIGKIGEPRPTQFVEDKSKLPAGQFLLELERQMSE